MSLAGFPGNGPYFDSEAGVSLEHFTGREIGCGDFATQMHCGLGVVLAADSPPAEALYSFLQVVTFLAVLAVAIKKLFEKNPRHTDLATKQELDEKLRNKADQKDLDRIEREVQKIDNDLSNTERRILKALDEKTESVIEEIKEFGKGAHNGRLKLWDAVRELERKTSSLEGSKEKS